MTIDTIQIEPLSKRETTELFQQQFEAKLDPDDLIALIEAQENYAFSINIAQENMQHNRYKDMGKIVKRKHSLRINKIIFSSI